MQDRIGLPFCETCNTHFFKHLGCACTTLKHPKCLPSRSAIMEMVPSKQKCEDAHLGAVRS